jgi:hypothetical protein
MTSSLHQVITFIMLLAFVYQLPADAPSRHASWRLVLLLLRLTVCTKLATRPPASQSDCNPASQTVSKPDVVKLGVAWWFGAVGLLLQQSETS